MYYLWGCAESLVLLLSMDGAAAEEFTEAEELWWE